MAWHPVGLKAVSGEISTIGGDGRTLTYRFGAHPSCVAADPSAVATEAATAVFVSPVEQWLAGPDAYWPSVVETHEVVVRLAAPLSNRVLVGHGHGHGQGHRHGLGLGTDTLGTPLTVLPG